MPAPRNCWFLLLSALLAACGGGGGDDSDNGVCSPHPAILTTPPTTAVAGQQYAYAVQTNTVCIDPAVPCDKFYLIQGPPGAHRAQDVVTWTPSAADVGKSFPFTIEMVREAFSFCEEQPQQSWTVSVADAPSANTPPSIAWFVAEPKTIAAGAWTTLSWAIDTPFDAARIDPPGFAISPPSPSPFPNPNWVMVNPLTTTTYVLTVTNAYGTSTATVQVVVH